MISRQDLPATLRVAMRAGAKTQRVIGERGASRLPPLKQYGPTGVGPYEILSLFGRGLL